MVMEMVMVMVMVMVMMMVFLASLVATCAIVGVWFVDFGLRFGSGDMVSLLYPSLLSLLFFSLVFLCHFTFFRSTCHSLDQIKHTP